jgi:hypothetical protein
MLLTFLCGGIRFLCLCLRYSPALAAEDLFLRKQLALYQERHVKRWRATDATRLTLIWLPGGSTGAARWSLSNRPR